MIETLRKIVQAVSEADDLQQALSLIVHEVRRAMATDVCTVYLSDRATTRLVFRATEGLNRDKIGAFSLARTEGLVGWVASRGEMLNLEDASAHRAGLVFHAVLFHVARHYLRNDAGADGLCGFGCVVGRDQIETVWFCESSGAGGGGSLSPHRPTGPPKPTQHTAALQRTRWPCASEFCHRLRCRPSRLASSEPQSQAMTSGHRTAEHRHLWASRG